MLNQYASDNILYAISHQGKNTELRMTYCENTRIVVYTTVAWHNAATAPFRLQCSL